MQTSATFLGKSMTDTVKFPPPIKFPFFSVVSITNYITYYINAKFYKKLKQLNHRYGYDINKYMHFYI